MSSSEEMSEIMYSEKYEAYICKACGEMLACSFGFHFCPYCGRQFRKKAWDESEHARLSEIVDGKSTAKVMTLAEATSSETQVWIEYRSTYVLLPAFVLDRNHNGSTVEVIARAASFIMFCGAYGKTWRCWTSRPTDAQREAELWNNL